MPWLNEISTWGGKTSPLGGAIDAQHSDTVSKFIRTLEVKAAWSTQELSSIEQTLANLMNSANVDTESVLAMIDDFRDGDDIQQLCYDIAEVSYWIQIEYIQAKLFERFWEEIYMQLTNYIMDMTSYLQEDENSTRPVFPLN